jgi:predicted HTH domain antitoxin
MHTVTIEIPDEISKQEVLLSVAKQLYDRGILSKKQGADLAGLPLNDFLMAVLPKNDPLRMMIRPTKKYDSAEEWIEDLKAKRNYKGFDKKKLDELVERLDIQEPLELLLSQLSK